MSEDNMKQLRELAEKATQGEWCCSVGLDERYGCFIYMGYNYSSDKGFSAVDQAQLKMQSNADYIVAANPKNIISLIQKIAKLEKQNDVMRDTLEYIVKTHHYEAEPLTNDLMSDLANERLFDITEAKKAIKEIEELNETNS